jgi:ABC-type Zn uptake system ZnuABC Zn-binding protein ZnuA
MAGKRHHPTLYLAAGIAFLLFLLTACVTSDDPNTPGEASNGRLRTVATTTIVGDVVAQIGGETVDLTVLLPVGADPHTFEPTPQDLVAIAEADLIFANGAGLETFLDSLLENAKEDSEVVSVSEGIDLRRLEDAHAEDEHEDEEQGAEELDPHVWFDPNNVIVWTQNIEQALSDLDPANAQIYTSNAEGYRRELEDLDRWIQEQVGNLPKENRKLVTDHHIFGYFADRYGFEQAGAVIPSFSAGAEPSAQQIAGLEDKIEQLRISAIFVGQTVNPALAERIGRDTKVQVVPLYTDSLTEAGGEADSYIDLMRYDVAAIVKVLAQGK